MTQHTFLVPDASCDHCKMTIEGAVGGLDGVDAVELDLATKVAIVDGGEPDTIVAAMAEVGYDATPTDA